MPSCMSCKYVNPLLPTHPAVCSARLSACTSAGPGLATYLVQVATAAYFVCVARIMNRRSLLQEQDQAGLVWVGCVYSWWSFAARVVCGGFVSVQRKKLVRRQETEERDERDFTQDPLCKATGKGTCSKRIGLADLRAGLDENELDAEDGRLSPHP